MIGCTKAQKKEVDSSLTLYRKTFLSRLSALFNLDFVFNVTHTQNIFKKIRGRIKNSLPLHSDLENCQFQVRQFYF